MVDQATAKYLGDNIGGVLAKALGEMAIAQPRDGVDFLSKWLKLHVEQEEARTLREQEEAKLVEERAKAQDEATEKATRVAKKEDEAQRKENLYNNLLEKFKDPETMFEDPLWSELLSVASTLTGAKAAYLGLVDEEGLEDAPGPLIRYTEALPGSEMMKDKVLPQGAGVTWGAVTENPDQEVMHLWRPPMPEPTEPVGDDGEAPLPPTIPYLPVSVECVTDVKEMHYFDLTRLGSYLAVPLVFSSYYTPEAYAECKKFEEEKKAESQKREEILQAYEAAVEDARAQGGDDAVEAVERPAELDHVDEKEMTLPGKVVKMVLCMDTLGTNAPIDEACFERALELAKACGQCKQHTEQKWLDAQALAEINDEDRVKLDEEIEAAKTRAEEETAEAMGNDEAEVPAEEELARDVVGKKWAFMRAARVLLDLKDVFLNLKTWVVPSPEMVNLVAATALFFGFKKVQLYPKRKQTIDWQVLLQVLDAGFLKTIAEFDPVAPRKGLEPEQFLAAVKAMKGPAQEYSPALELLHSVLDTALEYRTAYLQLRKANYEMQKQTEGEEFNLPPLEEDDDDFEGLA
mmetsp:Transcript_22712/g.59923  ORF Transcript_22712/g.59923 Transcript_22712/m.59923 type:complete len:575 (-) Transcript_22712:186-1910(-)